MPKYPWGNLENKPKRDIWLHENGLYQAYGKYCKQALAEEAEDIDEWAADKILEDLERVSGTVKATAPVREDWYWAFEHYGDEHDTDNAEKLKKDAPSPFAWSLLVGAWNSDGSWKAIQDKVAKDLFGGDISDDDDRAFVATGMPQALRERFSGLLGEAKRLLSGKLPAVFGRTEGS